MLEQIDAWDKALLVELNSHHSPFWDSIMWIVSAAPAWIPFYVALLAGLMYLQWRPNARENGVHFAIIFVSVSLAILLADQISSGFFKPFFGRLRPSHQPEIMDLLHLHMYDDGAFYRGGMYGFVSSHAANSFAIAWLVSAIANRKWVWTMMILWAILVSYSRIYLGVHYPGDIIGGTLVGIFSGWIASKAYFYGTRRWLN